MRGRQGSRVSSWLEVDLDLGGQPGVELCEILTVVPRDLDGNALDDLDEVSGRVVGRHQREPRAGRSRDALDLAVERLAAERVDRDVDRIAGADALELRL